MMKKTAKIAANATAFVTASLICYALFTPDRSPEIVALFAEKFSINISLIVPPLIIMFSVLFLASITRLALQRKTVRTIVHRALVGLAFLAFALPVFGSVGTGSSIITDPHKRAIFVQFAVPTYMMILSLTGIAIGRGFTSIKPRASIVGACTFLLSYGIGYVGVLSPRIEVISLPLAAGILSIGVGTLFGLLGSDDRTRNLSEWISKGRVRNFLFGSLLIGYLLFMRPPIIESFPQLIVVEWVIVSSVIAIAYFNIRTLSRHLYKDTRALEWMKKHTPIVKSSTGANFDKIMRIQKSFVEKSVKEPLLIHSIVHLRDLGMSEEAIMWTLMKLITYRDKNPSFWSLPWTRKKIEEENLAARKKILTVLVEDMTKGVVA